MRETQPEYDPPSVKDLGSLVEITGSAGNASKIADGGIGLTNKTA
jgi:hypothetical protein